MAKIESGTFPARLTLASPPGIDMGDGMRSLALLLLLLGGCSASPVGDVIDHYHPSRIEPGTYVGGVDPPPVTALSPQPLPPVVPPAP